MVHPFACQQGPKARYRLQGIFWLILEANRRRITHSRGKSRLLSASPAVPRLLARIRQAHLSHINDEPIKRLLMRSVRWRPTPTPLVKRQLRRHVGGRPSAATICRLPGHCPLGVQRANVCGHLHGHFGNPRTNNYPARSNQRITASNTQRAAMLIMKAFSRMACNRRIHRL